VERLNLSRAPQGMREKKNKMRIKPLVLLAVPILIVLPAAFGQHGIARNLQNGSIHDVWLGIVISTNDTTREITLESSGSETFTGVLKDHVSVKTKEGSIEELKPSDFPRGTKILVYYEPKTAKAGNEKVKSYNEIFRIEKAAKSVR
jgi:hypothetical protein